MKRTALRNAECRKSCISIRDIRRALSSALCGSSMVSAERTWGSSPVNSLLEMMDLELVKKPWKLPNPANFWQADTHSGAKYGVLPLVILHMLVIYSCGIIACRGGEIDFQTGVEGCGGLAAATVALIWDFFQLSEFIVRRSGTAQLRFRLSA